MLQSIQGDSILVRNVSCQELKKYQNWVDKTKWGGNMGYALYPSSQTDKVTLLIDSGFSHTWRNAILPALETYWGESRIIREVVFND